MKTVLFRLFDQISDKNPADGAKWNSKTVLHGVAVLNIIFVEKYLFSAFNHLTIKRSSTNCSLGHIFLDL